MLYNYSSGGSRRWEGAWFNQIMSDGPQNSLGFGANPHENVLNWTETYFLK